LKLDVCIVKCEVYFLVSDRQNFYKVVKKMSLHMRSTSRGYLEFTWF